MSSIRPQLRQIMWWWAPDAGVPEERAAAAVHPPHDAELLEELEGRVDGGEGDAGQLLARLGEELLRAQVPIAVAKQAVHDHSL